MMQTTADHQFIHRFRAILLGVLGLSLLLLTQPVHADIGPKPQMSFTFIFPPGNNLTIVEGVLLECTSSNCSDAKPLESLGPQRFSCDVTTCSAMAYQFRPYHRLNISFSDGVTRKSNVFSKRFFNAQYQVTVQPDALQVQEKLGGLPPLQGIFALGFASLVCISLFMLATFMILVLLMVREEQGKNNLRESKAFYYVSWGIALPLLALSVLITRALLLNVLLELLVMLSYTVIRHKPRFTGLTVVLLANLLSQPPLWYALHTFFSSNIWLPMALGEVLIILFETVVLYLTQRKSYTLKETFLISLLLNGTSLLVGLLLPL